MWRCFFLFCFAQLLSFQLLGVTVESAVTSSSTDALSINTKTLIYSLHNPVPTNVCSDPFLRDQIRNTLTFFRSDSYQARSRNRVDRALQQLAEVEAYKTQQIFQQLCNVVQMSQGHTQDTRLGIQFNGPVTNNTACRPTRDQMSIVLNGLINFMNPQAAILEIQQQLSSIRRCSRWFLETAKLRGVELNYQSIGYALNGRQDGSLELSYLKKSPTNARASCANENGDVTIPPIVSCGLRQTGIIFSTANGQLFLKDDTPRDEALDDPKHIPGDGMNILVAPIGQ